MSASTHRTALALTLAASAVAQGPRFRIDVRTDPGQMVWIAMAPRQVPGVQIPGVEGLLQLPQAGTVLFMAAPAGPGGKSRNDVPAFAFGDGMRWRTQLIALDQGGQLRLTRPFRMDGRGIVEVPAYAQGGARLDQNPVADGPDEPRPAAVNHALANGDTSFDLDARRNPVPPLREAGRSGALTETGNPELAEMSGRSTVSTSSMMTFPYSATVKLFMTFPGDPGHYYEGSGILIDPDHVLTAGHCAYDKDLGGEADKIWVIPGYSATGESTNVPWVTDMSTWGGSEPFGHSNVVDVKTWSDWRTSSSFKHDIAVLELNRPIGALAGWIGVDYSNDCSFYKDNWFYMRGYPAEGPYNGSRMTEQSGDFDSCPTKWEARFDVVSYGGQSGSGFYDYDAGD
ncbi:MAG: trypsin-like serine protease, partial [Planctomycetes bacterium]|nr:trypsin-like serine protease [Planctomycetota bacterium]